MAGKEIGILMGVLRHTRALVHQFRAHSGAAKQDTGKRRIPQFVELARLMLADGHLAPDEYYQYRLYDDSQFTWERKKEFLGRAMENRFIPYFKCGQWVAIGHDKLISYALFDRFGFASPEIYAIFHPSRGYGPVPALRTAADVAEHLRTSLSGPFVAKPVAGMWGRGVWAIDSIDRAADRMTMTNGETLDIKHFVDSIDTAGARANGVVFQELLRTHPAIREVCGDRICSVRMVVLFDNLGARLLATLWKVASGRSMADNYWEPGNMVAPIDPDTGVVGRFMSGLGREIRYQDNHPDTGKTLTGMTLPCWKDAVNLCLQAATTLPGIPMQAWDVAITTRGPVLLEVNINGGMRLPQLVKMRGLYHGEFKEFLRGYGFPRR